MEFHTLKRKLRNSWKRKLVRVITLVVVVTGTIAVQFILANVPDAIDLSSNAVAPPPVFGGQKILLEVDTSSGEFSISHPGKLSEEVDLHFSKARLAPSTQLEYDDEPPKHAVEIHCSPKNWRDTDAPMVSNSATPASGSKPKPCSTSISVTPVTDKTTPVHLAFYQVDTSGLDRYRHLVTELGNTEATVKLKLVPPLAMTHPDGNGQAKDRSNESLVDCGRSLVVGDWRQDIADAAQIQAVMEPGSTLRTRFTALETGLWSEPGGFYEPFSVRTEVPGNIGTPIKARSVSIKSITSDDTVFSAQSANNLLIRVDNLKVGKDRIQITLAGDAFVTVRGEVKTTSLLQRIDKYPYIAAVIGAINLLIFTWSVKVLKGLIAPLAA